MWETYKMLKMLGIQSKNPKKCKIQSEYVQTSDLTLNPRSNVPVSDHHWVLCTLFYSQHPRLEQSALLLGPRLVWVDLCQIDCMASIRIILRRSRGIAIHPWPISCPFVFSAPKSTCGKTQNIYQNIGTPEWESQLPLWILSFYTILGLLGRVYILKKLRVFIQ